MLQTSGREDLEILLGQIRTIVDSFDNKKLADDIQLENQGLQEEQQIKNQLLHMYHDQAEFKTLSGQIQKKVNKLSEINED